MEGKFEYKIDKEKYDIHVSFFPRLVEKDSMPKAVRLDEIISDFHLNRIYGEEVAAGSSLRDEGAIKEFKSHRPCIIPQCVVIGGDGKENIVSINHVLYIEIDTKTPAPLTTGSNS